jgi:DNA-directed RNA polymerase subunit RPC12/RpoP
LIEFRTDLQEGDQFKCPACSPIALLDQLQELPLDKAEGRVDELDEPWIICEHCGSKWHLEKRVSPRELQARNALEDVFVNEARDDQTPLAEAEWAHNGSSTLMLATESDSMLEKINQRRFHRVEDTPELPAAALQADGRDVQALRTDSGEATGLDAAGAPRTDLRPGEGALVAGEVRGEEARVLYAAMRVGAGRGAVLGTVHGDGAEAARERVVADLGVPASSFAATDLVATVGRADGGRRRLLAVEEVDGDGTAFDPLFERTPAGLEPTGRIDRGESRLVAALAGATETYASVREAIERRTTAFRREPPETDDGDERGGKEWG